MKNIGEQKFLSAVREAYEGSRVKIWIQDDSLRTLPNLLTIGRMLVVPVLLVLFPLDFKFLRIFCALLFAAASLTDFLDGFLARRFNSVTSIGATLDPIADKMLVGAGLILLVGANTMMTWMAGVLLCRDIAVSGLRLVAAERGFTIEVSIYGKVKTWATYVAIGSLMVNDDFLGIPLHGIGVVSAWLALILSLYSAYLYADAFSSETAARREPHSA